VGTERRTATKASRQSTPVGCGELRAWADSRGGDEQRMVRRYLLIIAGEEAVGDRVVFSTISLNLNYYYP
jgi:hypothetical protein